VTEVFSDFAMKRVIGELRRFAERLEQHPAIKGNPDAVKAVVDEYDNAKDGLGILWTDRARKQTAHTSERRI
jgi:hypothetical protein